MPVNAADIQVANSGSLGAAANGEFNGYVGREEAGVLAGSDDKAMRFWGNIAEVSRIYMGSPSAFNFPGDGGTNGFTLEVWAKPMIALTASSGSVGLIGNGSSGKGYQLKIQNNNKVRLTTFGVADSDSVAMAAPFASNQWYHIVATRGLSNVTFYVNGVQLGTAPVANKWSISTTNPMTLGRNAAGSEAFTGLLDEAAVYPSVLTAQQIAAHYNAALTNGPGYADVILADKPIGYWRLSEPKKVESTSVIANSGAVGAAGNGSVFGSPNSVTGGATSPLVAGTDTAMKFSQVGAYGLPTGGMIDVPSNAQLNTPSYSVECWARLEDWANVHQSPITSRQSGGGTIQGFLLYAAPATVTGQYTNSPRWEFWSGTGVNFNLVNAGARDVVTNKWTHLVGTYDDETKVMALYVDGRLARGTVISNYAQNLSTPLRLGAGGSELKFGQYHWRGGLDEVAVYPKALSPARVQAHYEAAMGTSPLVTDAPGVLVQPLGQTNWVPNATVVSCVVTGSLPMQFQWFHVAQDGSTVTAVPNATNMSLKLDPTTTAQSGNYYLAATNSLGGIETLWAYVEILPQTAPEFVLNAPASVPVYAGGTAGIPVIASNTPPITYQWQSNSVDIAGATSSILAVSNVQASYSTASFRARAHNPVSTTTSDPAQLTVLTPPATTYAAVSTSLNPLAFWRLGESSGSVAFDYWGGHPAVYANAGQGSTPGALLDNDDGSVFVSGAGSYVRTLESAPFNFSGFQDFTLSTFVKVNIAVPDNTPARLFSNWQTATTTNVAGGYGFGLYGMTKLRFTGYSVADLNANVAALVTDQWYHLAAVRSNNMVYLYIDGKLANSGAIGAIQPSNLPLQLNGNPNVGTTESLYGQLDEAAVFNRALSASEISALYAARYGALNPPAIVRQPSPEMLYVGGTARFDVVATGSQPMSYQWSSNGTPIPGATNASLVISGVTLANNNVNYTVTVKNQAGTAPSDNALLTVLQPAAYVTSVIADKPVSLWRLGESYGSIAYDYWGGYNGSDNGTSPVTFGTAGALFNDPNTAASFDGAASKIEVPYAAALNPTNFSVEVWAKVTGGKGTYRAVVSTRDEGTGFDKGFIIYATSSDIWSFWVGDGTTWQTLSGPAVVLDQWTHLAAVYDGQTKYFYVNGALVGSQTIGFAPNDLRPLRIGAGRNEFNPGDYWFNGVIDEVALYNTVLPAERVAYHYALGVYGNSTAPFMLREPRSQTVVAGAPVLLDPAAGGSPTLTYQWLKDGTPITGATNSQLYFPSAAYSDAGAYVLAVTSAVGHTNSSTARLTVMPAPSFALLTNDLVLHLKFDGDYQDSSGHGNSATAMGVPTIVAGKLGSGALHYSTVLSDGVVTEANYVMLPVSPDLQFTNGVNFSVAFWIKSTALGGDLPFLCNNDISYNGVGLTLAPSYNLGAWSWYLNEGAGVYKQGIGRSSVVNNTLNDGAWHHLVYTFDRAGFATVYRDGVMEDETSIAAAASWNLDTGMQLLIGQAAGAYAEAAVCDMDDFGIWRKVLTSYEALSIYNAAQGAGQSFDVNGPVSVDIIPDGANLTVVWQAGTLESNDDLGNPNGWAPVSGASAPTFTVTPSPGKKFYRVRL